MSLWHHALEGRHLCLLVDGKQEVGSGFLATYKPSIFFPFALEINRAHEIAVLWFAVKLLGTNGSRPMGIRGILTVFLCL